MPLVQTWGTMKLDVSQLRYLSRDDFRVLQAVEQGQRNVSTSLLSLTPTDANNLAIACCLSWTLDYQRVLLQHELVPVTLIESVASLR